jgi:hypothetical protein
VNYYGLVHNDQTYTSKFVNVKSPTMACTSTGKIASEMVINNLAYIDSLTGWRGEEICSECQRQLKYRMDLQTVVLIREVLMCQWPGAAGLGTPDAMKI